MPLGMILIRLTEMVRPVHRGRNHPPGLGSALYEKEKRSWEPVLITLCSLDVMWPVVSSFPTMMHYNFELCAKEKTLPGDFVTLRVFQLILISAKSFLGEEMNFKVEVLFCSRTAVEEFLPLDACWHGCCCHVQHDCSHHKGHLSLSAAQQ